jgi:hypothetical protein
MTTQDRAQPLRCAAKPGGTPCALPLRPCPWLPPYLEHAQKPRLPHYPSPMKVP